MFVPSHLDQHLVEHIMLMDGVVLLLEICVCCRVNVCVRVHLFACWCLPLLLGTSVFFYARVCVCVRVLVFLRMALRRENEWLRIAWNSQAWFWEKGAPAPFDVSPSLFMCCQSAGLHWPLRLCDGFDGQKYD